MSKDSKKPAIRFKGFTDDWEQRKCKTLCSISTGKSNTQDQVDDGEYPFFIRSDKAVKSNKYLYDEEAVITIGDGNIGKVFHYVNGKFDLHQRCYKMTNFIDVTAKYFYYYFSKNFYKRAMSMTAKATVDSVRLEMIADMDIQFPTDMSEQKLIADYFTNLDNLITLHQRKLDKLKNIKKALLEKMFPRNGENIPEVRFKGFSDDWEQRKFSELYAKVTEKNDLSFGADKIISVANMYFKEDTKESSDDYMKTYNVMRLGDIAFEGNRNKNYAHGRFVENTIGDGIVSHVFVIFLKKQCWFRC